jgi:hypothetical protein
VAIFTVAPRCFEFDDIRSGIGQELAAIRACDFTRVIDDAKGF